MTNNTLIKNYQKPYANLLGFFFLPEYLSLTDEVRLEDLRLRILRSVESKEFKICYKQV